MNGTSTNQNGWRASAMRTYLNGSFLDLLPDAVKSGIVEVDKMTNNVGSTSATTSVTATSDKVWLLSSIEAYGSTVNSGTYGPVYAAEGSQYKYYKDLKVTTSSYSALKKYPVGSTSSASDWWLRSPDASTSGLFLGVIDGYWDNCDYADRTYGVSPGFCF
ncbi:MAG: DUF6273 domain-containing protein [Coriobacteriia bacterium]|nr:DUF6273 domain-containing protein [Coriobacteriia bacterium]